MLLNCYFPCKRVCAGLVNGQTNGSFCVVSGRSTGQFNNVGLNHPQPANIPALEKANVMFMVFVAFWISDNGPKLEVSALTFVALLFCFSFLRAGWISNRLLDIDRYLVGAAGYW